MSLMAINLDQKAEAQYLHSLAQALDLSQDQVNALHDRARVQRAFTAEVLGGVGSVGSVHPTLRKVRFVGWVCPRATLSFPRPPLEGGDDPNRSP